MQSLENRFFELLQNTGMPRIPDEFSVVPLYQAIPCSILTEIDRFIDVFERVTTRPLWQETVAADAPQIAQQQRPEICFFSAFDLHLPPNAPENWQLIEFNDNGSGLLFAERINRTFYETFELALNKEIVAPSELPVFNEFITNMIAAEAKAFYSNKDIGTGAAFKAGTPGLILILDDSETLQQGKFRLELSLLQELLRRNGWQAEISSPPELIWDGKHLSWQDLEVAFIVNRCTDFLWHGDQFEPLRTAYLARQIYVAPNPFTYATRSDKRLLEYLSLADWDHQLGIQPEERTVLSAHIPTTYLIREDNLEEIAGHKADLFFKPTQGFAGRGILESSNVGRSRLRRLLKSGQGYVAQKKVAKSLLQTAGNEHPQLWTDLRIWAYRGQRFMLSGRASTTPELMDLNPPGGWLPTFALR